MMKKWMFCLLLCSCSYGVMAKKIETTCQAAPNYDIVITPKSVEFMDNKETLTFLPNGQLQVNGQTVNIDNATKKQIVAFQSYLRKELPDFIVLSHRQLDGVRNTFATAIDKRLGNDSRLVKHLNRLYGKLNVLLQDAIYEQDNVLIFKHEQFNLIKVNGEDIATKVFTTAVADSLIRFNIFKNYSAIKKIAADEWKTQKPELKLFNQQVCDLIENIDNQYGQLRIRSL